MQTPSGAPEKARKARAFFRDFTTCVTRRSGDLCCSESTDVTEADEDEDEIPSTQCLHQER